MQGKTNNDRRNRDMLVKFIANHDQSICKFRDWYVMQDAKFLTSLHAELREAVRSPVTTADCLAGELSETSELWFRLALFGMDQITANESEKLLEKLGDRMDKAKARDSRTLGSTRSQATKINTPNTSDNRELIRLIRETLAEAAKKVKEPFFLLGIGHEPRVTLSRGVAAALRGLDLPRVRMSRGPRFRYPKRLFDKAIDISTKKRGSSPLEIRDSCVYRTD